MKNLIASNIRIYFSADKEEQLAKMIKKVNKEMAPYIVIDIEKIEVKEVK